MEEYYLTNSEIEILKTHADDIAKRIAPGSMVIELGSGNLRKVNLLLQALEQARKHVDYYALDLSRHELERTLSLLPRYEYVTCRGLLGTYDDGRAWLQTPAVVHRQKTILTLGSSVANFAQHESVAFLRSFAQVMHDGDALLVGLDSCLDAARVYHAYNDKEGVTHKFYYNGLDNANAILGSKVFDADDWRIIGEYVHDADGSRHQAFYAPVRDVFVFGERVQPHERVKIEESYKYSEKDADTLWRQAGLVGDVKWMNSSREHGESSFLFFFLFFFIPFFVCLVSFFHRHLFQLIFLTLFFHISIPYTAPTSSNPLDFSYSTRTTVLSTLYSYTHKLHFPHAIFAIQPTPLFPGRVTWFQWSRHHLQPGNRFPND